MTLRAPAALLLALALPSAPASAAPGAPPRTHRLDVGGAVLDVSLEPGHAVGEPPLLAWVEGAARAVSAYYGRFPVPRAAVHVRAGRGSGVRQGLASGWDGPRVRITVGVETGVETLARDWMMTHELLHLGFPTVADRHHWIEEGTATYVEPVARARSGDLSPERAWWDLVAGLPQGLPSAGDRGLDHTPTWGRTYWGGALFCLLADVEIRERTANEKGLEHALRAIAAAGGTIDRRWELERALAVGDEAVGTAVLVPLWRRMRAQPHPVDLDALWRRLGVERRGRRILLDDRASLAHVRRAIAAERPLAASQPPGGREVR